MKEVTYEQYCKLSYEKRKKFTGIVKWFDCSQSFLQNGKLHRIDGPAAIDKNGTQQYRINGKLHRIDGPAFIWPDGDVEYWINDEQVSKEAQELYYFLLKLKGLV